MEKFQLLRQEALKNYHVAEHMLNVTYPLIKDSKLLLGVTDNIYQTYRLAIQSILYHERIFKRIPPFPDTFEGQFQLLHQKRQRYKLSQEYFDIILELREALQLHKSSPVEFSRRDRFIICTKNYKVKAITSNQLKNYLNKTREFLDFMNEITSRNQNIFQNYE